MKFVLVLCFVAFVAQQAQAASVEARADLCPDSGVKDMMMCMDGSLCDQKKGGWDCCGGPGTPRKACPKGKIMCAGGGCRGANCCKPNAGLCDNPKWGTGVATVGNGC